MSVLIKDMDAPFTCLTCDFHKCAGGVGDFCSLTKRRQFRFKNRPKDCPLIELPPHGRLIDADAAVANRNADMNWCYDLHDLPDYLSDCPTIIPASEEGE